MKPKHTAMQLVLHGSVMRGEICGVMEAVVRFVQGSMAVFDFTMARYDNRIK